MSSQKVAEFVGSRIESNQSLTKISEELLDNCVAPDTKGDGTGCDNMTAVIIKIEDTFLNKKTTPKFNEQEDCKKTDERLEIIEESNGNENSNGDTPNFTESGFGFEGSRFVDSNMSEEEKKNCNVNAGDGSSRKCGRFLSEGCYDVIDFEFKTLGAVFKTNFEKNDSKYPTPKKQLPFPLPPPNYGNQKRPTKTKKTNPLPRSTAKLNPPQKLKKVPQLKKLELRFRYFGQINFC